MPLPSLLLPEHLSLPCASSIAALLAAVLHAHCTLVVLPPPLPHALPPCPLPQVLCRKLMLIDEIKSDPKKDARAYAERVASGFRPEVPRRWPHALRALITACWAQEPAARPSFDTMLQVLQEVRHAWHWGAACWGALRACCTPLASCLVCAGCLALRQAPAPACCRSRPLA